MKIKCFITLLWCKIKVNIQCFDKDPHFALAIPKPDNNILLNKYAALLFVFIKHKNKTIVTVKLYATIVT